ncbi:MAG TPA: ParA family protein [Xanthobacteraceae bacterium]
MNVVVFASRKGGSGKSTLAAHLAAHVHKSSRPCLLVDADPQGSLTLWHQIRGTGEPPLKVATRGIGDILRQARQDGVEWVFIDTPPNMSAMVTDTIRAATLVVIPARPGIFDLDAVKETIDFIRQLRKPYAVVINGAPARREEADSPIVAQARESLAALRVPVWGGQITNRANFILALAEGEGAKEYDADSRAAVEVARLWSAIDRSVKAIRGHTEAAGAMHKQAA